VINRLWIAGTCLALLGCATVPPEPVTRADLPETVRFDTIPWQWADYSNRVWISVSGVGLEVKGTNGPSIKKVSFSYSPNTGKSLAEAIAITSFDMFSGDRAERFLLKVLFGMQGTWLSQSNFVSDGKAFHSYRFKTSGDTTNTAYFDGTMYHNLF